jgi:hypothetical protein
MRLGGGVAALVLMRRYAANPEMDHFEAMDGPTTSDRLKL